MSVEPDEQLVRVVASASSGDADAWEELYRNAYPRLFAYARRRVPDDDAADDAVSETMTRAIDRIGRFRWTGAGFEAWLFGILRNVVYESYRSRETPTATVAEVAAPDADALDGMVTTEQAAAVRAAFARLAPEQQELLELRVVAGLTSAGAGEVLGKRSGAIRMAQARALAQLRHAVEEVGGGR